MVLQRIPDDGCELIQIKKKMTRQTNVTWYPGDLRKAKYIRGKLNKNEIGTNNLGKKSLLCYL